MGGSGPLSPPRERARVRGRQGHVSLFISFEGGEGSGKSTQADLLTDRFRAAGVQTLLVREPGTTELGIEISRWLKRGMPKEGPVSPDTELLLFESARAELVTKIIRPALEQDGAVIIADRYADSTTAYQGYGRNLPLDRVKSANELAVQGLMPALTFLLDCPPAEGLARAQAREDSGRDRFEEESLDFHTRVRKGYLALARREPDRWRVIDAMRPADEVHAEIWKHAFERLLSPPFSKGG